MLRYACRESRMGEVRPVEERSVTRQSELIRVLGQMAADLPNPDWVALVDNDGLLVACVPSEPPVEIDRISAMTAASVMMGNRVLDEIDGGRMRYASIAGSDRQHLTVMVSPDRLLSIGLRPEVAAQATFGALGKWLPEVLKVLRMRFTRE
jgi:predicted regulator of Ras-like GTPase activity (Roadblock/LC7/MglB family)